MNIQSWLTTQQHFYKVYMIEIMKTQLHIIRTERPFAQKIHEMYNSAGTGHFYFLLADNQGILVCNFLHERSTPIIQRKPA